MATVLIEGGLSCTPEACLSAHLSILGFARWVTPHLSPDRVHFACSGGLDLDRAAADVAARGAVDPRGARRVLAAMAASSSEHPMTVAALLAALERDVGVPAGRCGLHRLLAATAAVSHATIARLTEPPRVIEERGGEAVVSARSAPPSLPPPQRWLWGSDLASRWFG